MSIFRQLALDEAPKFVMRNSRATDPETSALAAADAHRHAESHRETVLKTHALHPQGLTDFALAELTGIQQTSAGKRRLELERDGLIEYAGTTRPSPSGSAARVYRITEKGKVKARGY